MKKIILAVCLVFITSLAYADFYVYYDKDTDEVLFISDQEKKVKISEEDSAKIVSEKLPGSIKDYELTESYTDYKFKGKKFIINTTKISDRVNEEIANQESLAQKLVDQESAKGKLMALGLTEAEFLSLIE